jgi:coproporphyrinogen III oxidase-like Fe-S oxidoreductase
MKLLKNIYIHIPFCNRKCSYCDFPVHALGLKSDLNHKVSMIDSYVSKLNLEVDLKMSSLKE